MVVTLVSTLNVESLISQLICEYESELLREEGMLNSDITSQLAQN